MITKSKKAEYLALNAIGEDPEMYTDSNEAKNYLLKMYRFIFDKIYNWMVVVDKDGYIIMINKNYCQFLGVKQEDAIGKYVTEVIENTRMHIVVKTGQKEIGDVQDIKGNQMIADRIPIYQDGEIIGAVGTVIFKNLVEFDVYVKNILKMEKQLEFYKKELKKAWGSEYTFENIIGTSQKLMEAKTMAKKVAGTKSNILLLGESGTGKELFAHAIHNESPRSEYPLIKINCGAIPSELLESELFGYEEGAFTGAKKGGKPGKFELANKSTIFLDEIGDLPLNMQVKILRVIQEREIERIGSVKSQKVDVRIIAATNKNLEEMVEKKEFREDLYYRLNVINIRIPPLRERMGDVPLLTHHLIKKLSSELNLHVAEISYAALEALCKYSWPGNIRELANVLERAINLIEKEATVMLEHLPYHIRKEMQAEDLAGLVSKNRLSGSLKDIFEDIEKKAIEQYLKETNGNKYQTAKLLGISRTNLYEKIRKYQLDMLT